MAKKTESKKTVTNVADDKLQHQQDSAYNTTINRPDIELTSKGLVSHRRPIDGPRQLVEVARALEARNLLRNTKNAAIQRRFNGEPPRSIIANKSLAQGWNSNFNSRWLTGIVERMSVRLNRMLSTSRTLTWAYLPQHVDNYKQKSELIQERVTKTIRSWEGWNAETKKLTTELCLVGCTCFAVMDPYQWRPATYRFEDLLVEENTGQFSGTHNIIILRKDWQISEIVDLIADREAAEEAGFDVEQCVDAINNAIPSGSITQTAPFNPRRYEDWIRQGNIGLNYELGQRIIPSYIGYVKEWDGSVTQYIVRKPATGNTYDTDKCMFYSESRFKTMPDAVTLFTFQAGDGTYYGTKGLGHMLYNVSTMIERVRNAIADQVILSACLLIKTDAKLNTKAVMTIASNFIFIDKDAEVVPTKFPAESGGLQALDALLAAQAEQQAGTYISAQLQPDGQTDKTATEARIDFTREIETSEGILASWEAQFSSSMTALQKRIFSDEVLAEAKRELNKKAKAEAKYDDDNNLIPYEIDDSGLVDHESLKLTVGLIESGITIPELKLWRKQSASKVVAGDNEQTPMNLQAASALAADPRFANMIDQNKMLKMQLVDLLGPENATELMMMDVDPKVQVEQMREQMLENTAIKAKDDVPVSPRDNDLCHLRQLIMETDKVMTAYKDEPQLPGDEVRYHDEQKDRLDYATGLLTHFAKHIDNATGKGIDPKQLAPFEEFAKATMAVIHDIVTRSEEQRVQNMARLGVDPRGLQAGGQPPAGAPAPMAHPISGATGTPGAPILPNDDAQLSVSAPKGLTDQVPGPASPTTANPAIGQSGSI